MTPTEFLRAMARRQRKKGTTAVPLPACTPGAQLPGLDALRSYGVTAAEAAANVSAVMNVPWLPMIQAPGALPGGDAMWTGGGQQCGCEVRYSACRCAREGGRP